MPGETSHGAQLMINLRKTPYYAAGGGLVCAIIGALIAYLLLNR